MLADERGTTGQFILSGSQNFLLMRQIEQSLAGHAYIGHLLPFSTAELHRLPCRVPEQDVPKPLVETPLAGDWPSLAATGFYPPVHDRGLRPCEWASQYFQTYLQSLTQIGDLEAFRRFVLLCAGHIGHLINLNQSIMKEKRGDG